MSAVRVAPRFPAACALRAQVPAVLSPAHQRRSTHLSPRSLRQPDSAGPAGSSLTGVCSVDEEEARPPFLEPLLRSLVLGIGAGGIAEAIHVLHSVAATAAHTGSLHTMPGMLNAAARSFAPLWLLDHMIAIGVWVLLYLLDVQAISRILKAHPGDPCQAARSIRNTPTLPKRMLPVPLTSVKRAVLKAVAGLLGKPQLARDMPSRLPSAAAPATLSKQDMSLNASATTTVTAPLPPKPVPEDPTVRLPSESCAAEAKRSKELQDRAAYLKNFWYVIGLSQDLHPGQVRETRAFGRSLALFRDESGAPCCVEGLCPHRGALLGQGWMKDVGGKPCVVCPYHAWAFDGAGRLQEVPALEGGGWPQGKMLESYPVVEEGGFIWMFYGSKDLPELERPRLPRIPELADPNWRTVYAEIEFDAPHWSVFDNALDFAHIHTVHRSSFGNPDQPVLHDVRVTARDAFSVSGTLGIHNKPANPLWEWTRTPRVPVTATAWLPSSSAVHVTLGAGLEMVTVVNTTPLDGGRAVNRFCIARNFALTPVADGMMRRSMFRIQGEDRGMVESLRPEDTPREYSLAPDLLQVAFRKLRQEWIEIGYGVPPSATEGPLGRLNS